MLTGQETSHDCTLNLKADYLYMALSAWQFCLFRHGRSDVRLPASNGKYK